METNAIEHSPREIRREAVKAIASPLCQLCREIIADWGKLRAEGYFDTHEEVEWKHHTTAREFLLASAAACGICSTIEARLQEMLDSVWKFFELYGDHPTKLRANHHFLFFDGEDHIPNIIWFTEIQVPAASLGMYSNLKEKFTGHFSVLDRGRMWFKQCLDTHNMCTRQRLVGYYPPRILVIEGPTRLRLIDAHGLNPGLPYATLSYCWGRNPRHLKLTPQTEEALRASIDTTSLAKTFTDAMDVCMHMGIKLLWIDSLCIMQEGPTRATDWQAHIAEMCRIYENCILNISADHGENAEAGCFSFRDPDLVKPSICKSDDREDGELMALYRDDLWESSITSSALMRRGWVHQERLLSPRVLRFGAYQLFWECGGLAACETLPTKCPRTDLAITSLSSSVRNEELRWYRIVNNFTKAELTIVSDRLPAIGGIALRVSSLINSEYIAGLFRNSLPHALLWRRADTWLVRRSSPYVAPSWSWASCDGEVTFALAFRSYKAVCKVEEVNIAHVSSTNPFGQLLHGSLTLSGPRLEGKHIGQEVMPHGTDERWSYLEDNRELYRRDSTTQVTMLACFDEDPVMQTRDKLIYLIVLESPSARGLIIKPADQGTCSEHYVRIGVFHIIWLSGRAPDFKGCKMVTITIV